MSKIDQWLFALAIALVVGAWHAFAASRDDRSLPNKKVKSKAAIE